MSKLRLTLGRHYELIAGPKGTSSWPCIYRADAD